VDNILGDQLGSTSVVVDAGGAVVATQGYYPYGETRYTTQMLYTDRLFTPYGKSTLRGQAGQQQMAGRGEFLIVDF
jgi:hypothetical protein